MPAPPAASRRVPAPPAKNGDRRHAKVRAAVPRKARAVAPAAAKVVAKATARRRSTPPMPSPGSAPRSCAAGFRTASASPATSAVARDRARHCPISPASTSPTTPSAIARHRALPTHRVAMARANPIGPGRPATRCPTAMCEPPGPTSSALQHAKGPRPNGPRKPAGGSPGNSSRDGNVADRRGPGGGAPNRRGPRPPADPARCSVATGCQAGSRRAPPRRSPKTRCPGFLACGSRAQKRRDGPPFFCRSRMFASRA